MAHPDPAQPAELLLESWAQHVDPATHRPDVGRLVHALRGWQNQALQRQAGQLLAQGLAGRAVVAGGVLRIVGGLPVGVGLFADTQERHAEEEVDRVEVGVVGGGLASLRVGFSEAGVELAETLRRV